MKAAIFILFLCLSINIFSQDIIVLNSGSQIEAVIIEIADSIIKYRKFNNQQGPVYSIDKQKIKEINYSDGRQILYNEDLNKIHYDNPQQSLTYIQRKLMYEGERLKKKDVRILYADYPDALSAYKTSAVLNGVGWGLLVISLGHSVLTWSSYISTGEISWGNVLLGGGLIGGSIACFSISSGQFKKSVGIFNKANSSLKKSSSYDLNLGVTANGVGIILRF